jgi:hypothetical protein
MKQEAWKVAEASGSLREEAPSKLLIGQKRVQGCENRVNPPFSENEGQQGNEEAVKQIG